MKIKRIISCLLCLTLIFSVNGCSSKSVPLKILGSNKELITTLKSDSDLKKNNQKSYAQAVVEESVKIIAELENCSEKKAKKKLYKNGYTVYTYFDTAVNEGLSTACKAYDNIGVGSAVTDLNGNLVAVYSTNKDTNYALTPNAPCSAFKPLSVYAPAMDEGVINWTSRYEDSPYKQVRDSNGGLRDWPANATGIYTERYAYIFQAVQESLNTVAVKCLADFGVENSLGFLRNKLGMSLSDEKYTSAVYGEDEIIGNIAMGYLEEGTTPIDMAGYYQIFANGGVYTPPKTVLKIVDSENNEIYKREDKATQVIKNTTSEIMNRLLREVVAPAGTGSDAACDNIEVAGKTGTDDYSQNNWFVGVTPEYSCAFWHFSNEKNIAPKIFSDSVKKIYEKNPKAKTTFTYKSGLSNIAYCTETGKMAKPSCYLIRLGYFTHDNVPTVCDRH